MSSFFEIWSPEPDKLNAYYAFAQKLVGGLAATQEVYQENLQLERQPESVFYFMYLIRSTLSNAPSLSQEDEHLLAHLSIRVKNTVMRSFKKLDDFKELLPLARDMIFCMNFDRPPSMANVLADALIEWMLLTKRQPHMWDEIIQQLIELSHSQELPVRRNMARVLGQILVRTSTFLDKSPTEPLPAVIARAMQLCEDPDLTVVAPVAEGLTYVVPYTSDEPLRAVTHSTQPEMSPDRPKEGPRLIDILNCTLNLANRDGLSDTIKQTVCTIFQSFITWNPEPLTPYMDPLLSYMLDCSYNPVQDNPEADNTLTRIAFNFWISYFPIAGSLDEYPEKAELYQQRAAWMENRLPKLLDVVFGAFILTDEDIELAGGNKPDSSVREDEGAAFENINADDDDDESFEDYDDNGNMREGRQASLRRYAGLILERTIYLYGQSLIEPVLEHMNTMFGSDDWRVQEAALFAVGVVGRRFFKYLGAAEVDEIFHHVLNFCESESPILRSTALWSLFHCPSLIFKHRPDLLERMIQYLIRDVQSRHRQVASFAYTHLARLIEKPVWDLARFKTDVVGTATHLVSCTPRWLMPFLCTIVLDIAERVDIFLPEQEEWDAFAKALLERWRDVSEDITSFSMLVPATGEFAAYSGGRFMPYLEECFAYIAQVVEQNVDSYIVNRGPEQDDDDEIESSDELDEFRQYVDSCLSFISAVMNAVDTAQVVTLLLEHGIIDRIMAMLDDPSPSFHESFFAVVGDLAKFDIGLLKPYLDRLIPVMAHWIGKEEGAEGSKNAAWAAGMIGPKLPPDSQYLAELLNALAEVICDEDLRVLDEDMMRLWNVADALGAITFLNPEVLESVIAQLCLPWLQLFVRSDSNSVDGAELSLGFAGFCRVVSAFSDALLTGETVGPLFMVFGHLLRNYFVGLSDESQSRAALSMGCVDEMRNVMNLILTKVPAEEWQRALQELPAEEAMTLTGVFDLRE